MGSLIGVLGDDVMLMGPSSFFAKGLIGGDKGGCGPRTMRICEVEWAIDLGMLECANESYGEGSGGDIRLLMSSGFFDSALIDGAIGAAIFSLLLVLLMEKDENVVEELEGN
jgi:hypothetical protein